MTFKGSVKIPLIISNVFGELVKLSFNVSIVVCRRSACQCLTHFIKAAFFVDFIRFFHLIFDMSKIETPKIDTFLEFWAQVKCAGFWHKTVA